MEEVHDFIQIEISSAWQRHLISYLVNKCSIWKSYMFFIQVEIISAWQRFSSGGQSLHNSFVHCCTKSSAVQTTKPLLMFLWDIVFKMCIVAFLFQLEGKNASLPLSKFNYSWLLPVDFVTNLGMGTKSLGLTRIENVKYGEKKILIFKFELRRWGCSFTN